MLRIWSLWVVINPDITPMTNSILVKISFQDKVLEEKYGLPTHSTPGSAGYDLRAVINDPIYLLAGDQAIIKTGISIHIEDPNFVGIIVPRSGLGFKKNLVLGNGTGVIDSDYTGEIHIALKNHHHHKSWKIEPYERIAQLMFMPVYHAAWDMVDELSNSDRGEKGFGSTGRV